MFLCRHIHTKNNREVCSIALIGFATEQGCSWAFANSLSNVHIFVLRLSLCVCSMPAAFESDQPTSPATTVMSECDTELDTTPGVDQDLLDRAACPASWTVLLSGRLGMELPMRKGGRRSYLAVDGKTRLCQHGMTSSAIASWMRVDNTNRKCPCLNLDGLTASRRTKTPRGWTTPPVHYFEVLESRGAKEIVLHGDRLARELPHSEGSMPLYMLQSGQILCQHGNSETTLRSRAKQLGRAPKRGCDCAIVKSSWRQCRLQNSIGKRLF